MRTLREADTGSLETRRGQGRKDRAESMLDSGAEPMESAKGKVSLLGRHSKTGKRQARTDVILMQRRIARDENPPRSGHGM